MSRGLDKTWRIGLVPASLKNGRRLVRAKGRSFFVPSIKAKADQEAIADLLLGCIPTDKDVVLEVIWYVPEDAVEFTVWERKVQPPAKGRKGRSDLQGIIEAVCDAIQGRLVKNDRQVSMITGVKEYGDASAQNKR